MLAFFVRIETRPPPKIEPPREQQERTGISVKQNKMISLGVPSHYRWSETAFCEGTYIQKGLVGTRTV